MTKYERIKNIKVKIAEKPNIRIGDHFIYKNIEWVCLDVINGNFLAITTKIWKAFPFDVGRQNNWKESTLRRMVNDEFLDKLNKEHLVMQTSDLTADNGDKSYGTCEDYVTILSCDQYRKYRDIIPHYSDEWVWLLTPWNCSSDTDLVRIVYPANGFNSYYFAHRSIGVAPVVLFSSEILKSLRYLKTKSIRKVIADET